MRRRIKTVDLSPEEIGLCGCWRIAALERVTIDLSKPEDQRQPVAEIAYYAASKTEDEMGNADLLNAIVGHWATIENGTHRVRDVTLREDACQVRQHQAARNMVTLRNLAIGLYNLLLYKKKTDAPSLPSWQRSMSIPQAIKHIMR